MNHPNHCGLNSEGFGQGNYFFSMTGVGPKQFNNGQHIESHLEKNKTLQQMLGEMCIGQRIHNELKEQGRSVSWLARQLNMERTSLYYTFHNNSIDLELLLRISAFLGHNFMQDVADVFKAYGL